MIIDYQSSCSVSFKTILRMPELQNVVIQFNGCALASDMIIAGVMCFLLHTSRTGIRTWGTSFGIFVQFN
jgi:hypothetical protein